jgi:hypothetical protein
VAQSSSPEEAPDRPILGPKDHLYDEDLVPRIAELLSAEARQASYLVGGTRVFEITTHNQALDKALLLTLWPGIARVDARIGDIFAMIKAVGRVTLEPGVEVVFWKQPGPGYLLVTVAGKLSVAG